MIGALIMPWRICWIFWLDSDIGVSINALRFKVLFLRFAMSAFGII